MPKAQFGESNGRAVLTDREAELMRELHAIPPLYGEKRGYWTTSRLALKFEVSRSTVQKIIAGTRRP